MMKRILVVLEQITNEYTIYFTYLSVVFFVGFVIISFLLVLNIRKRKILTKQAAEFSAVNEFQRKMFKAAPIGLTVWDDKLNFVDCNDAVLKMHGVTKEYYLDNVLTLSPEFQPDGSNSRDKTLDNMRRVINGETIQKEWVHCTRSGESIPCEITTTRIKQGNKYIGLVYIYDLRNIKELEKKAKEAYMMR